ncbi:MAG: hypothetical protein II925_01855, partial [Methanomicrobium sp.]|nr:hypothetical protein [Methanomicrobium sp.]
MKRLGLFGKKNRGGGLNGDTLFPTDTKSLPNPGQIPQLPKPQEPTASLSAETGDSRDGTKSDAANHGGTTHDGTVNDAATHDAERKGGIGSGNAGIISVDEADISELTLKGATTFEIEELKIRGGDAAGEPEPAERERTISAIEKIYSAYSVSKDERQSDRDTSAKEETRTKKKGLFGFAKALVERKREEYDPAIHGALVDLSFQAAEGIEEVELYGVNAPYAYVRITFDRNTNEYAYNVLEPTLNPAQEKLRQEIVQRLFETLNVSTKDLTKEKA